MKMAVSSYDFGLLIKFYQDMLENRRTDYDDLFFDSSFQQIEPKYNDENVVIYRKKIQQFQQCKSLLLSRADYEQSQANLLSKEDFDFLINKYTIYHSNTQYNSLEFKFFLQKLKMLENDRKKCIA